MIFYKIIYKFQIKIDRIKFYFSELPDPWYLLHLLHNHDFLIIVWNNVIILNYVTM